MLFYYLFWMITRFIIHFYSTFGTNLLTEGPAHIAVLLPVSVFRRKGISNGVQTEWNLRQRDFQNEHDPEDLDPTSSNQRGRHEVATMQGACLGGRHAPHPRGPLVAPPTYFFILYILIYPENIWEHHETLFPPPQPSVPKRSHLGAFLELRRRGNQSRRASTSTP